MALQELEKSANSRKKPIYSVVVLTVFAVLALAGFGAYWWFSRPLIDHEVIKDATFSVYTPKELPEGYTLDYDQTKLTGQMLTYTFVSSEGDKKITVTVQPMPEGFDMQKLIGSGSVDSTAVSSGTLYNLSVGSGSKYLLDAGDSLIFLTSERRIETSTITEIVNNLSRQS